MISNKKQILLLVFLVLSSLYISVNSQEMYSPYSMLGLGDIETRDYSRTSGMAGIGIGIREYDYLNAVNPAGLTDLDSLRFIFDISANLKQSSFSRNSETDNIFSGNFRKMAFGFRVSRKWSASVGVKPFSDVGYQIYSSQAIEGSTATKDIYLEGSGGLYSVYLSNAYKLTPYLSLGINTMYIAGTIHQVENQVDYLFDKESHAAKFYNTFGLQYHKGALTLGLVYGYKQKMSLDNTTSIYDSSGTLLEENSDRSTTQFIPENIGVGFSLKKNKLVIGADYQYHKWEGLSSGVSNVKIVDSHILKAGVGYTPKEEYYRIRRGTQYQFGASLSRSYIQVKGKDAIGFSVSGGASLPLSGSLLNIGLEYGNVLKSPSGYIKESYMMLTINYTLFESWFRRNKMR